MENEEKIVWVGSALFGALILIFLSGHRNLISTYSNPLLALGWLCVAVLLYYLFRVVGEKIVAKSAGERTNLAGHLNMMSPGYVDAPSGSCLRLPDRRGEN